MSQFATLSLENQAGTEVPLTVSTIDRTSNVATWTGAGSAFDARIKASFSITLPTARSTRAKVKAKVIIPVMSPVDPTVKVDENIVNIDFSLPKNSVLLDRQNLRAMAADFLTDPVIVAAIENFEGVY